MKMNHILINILSKFFDEFDKDKNGQLDRDELRLLLDDLLCESEIFKETI